MAEFGEPPRFAAEPNGHDANAGERPFDDHPAHNAPGPEPVSNSDGPELFRHGGHEQDQDEQGYRELDQVLGQRVVNYFYGHVNATDATFGFGSPSSPGLAPGLVEPDEIDLLLRDFLHPDGYDAAAGKLQSKNLLILVGEEGNGRRAAAFSLLRDLLGEDVALRSLSPANSLAQLASPGSLKPRSGYVILDYLGETGTNAVQDFEIRRLRTELRRHRSFLVITSSPAAQQRLALREFSVPWSPPDPLDLFDHCAGNRLPPDTPETVTAELRARVRELRKPADVVAVANNLGGGVNAALETLRDSTKECVQQWFDNKPEAKDLLPVAALAFANGLPERTFEELAVSLDHCVRNMGKSAGDLFDEDEPPQQPAVSIDQTRVRWKQRAVGIAEAVQRADDGEDRCRSERRVEFTSPRVRDLVIGDLHDRYGYELWYPLRQWLEQLSVEGSLAVRQEVARGVALLARYALAEVEEKLLEVWAGGVSSQRVTAASVLQFMCADEQLAGQALTLALSWVEGRGQERAITATMALAGELGSIYRLDSLHWLWVLASRGERIASAARRALVLLLATAEHEPERARLVLRYLRTQARYTPSGKARGITLGIIVQVLGARRLSSEEPLAAFLLRTDPSLADQFGALWLTVLHSPCRSSAIAELCRTLVALREDEAASSLVRLLGETMRDGMNEQQRAALRNDLPAALHHPRYSSPGIQQLARLLLNSGA
ncbi:hypothetical protein [Streptomyces paromomycinus]|uniref:Uncharacterized protein n=1 Tax=Streptomyces paromomycinus TaxID=92743 RepID=A0A401WD49_STREY|nr:hypothetical protein [Streptomyces paromomycinus]GCD47237.1 hypothetical protein GKJPGBOP_07003 [Streptomyces paromomycinus]